MKKIDIEKYRKKKEEYDKKILELDYKVVEKSVQLYNAKSANNEELRDNRKVEDLSYEINKLEEEKKKQTETIWNNIKELLIVDEYSVINTIPKEKYFEFIDKANEPEIIRFIIAEINPGVTTKEI